jgi:lipoate-protein ligase B
MRKFDVIRAGIISHEIVAEEMKRLQNLRIDNKIPDTLILVEHPEVVTIGPRARNDGVLVPEEYATSSIDRGGGITWHGPGQLVAYPIFHWNLEGESNVANIINLLEDWIINSLHPLGIETQRDERMQGVWHSGQKISSVGLQFLKWVSRHGFTINYNTPPGRVEDLAGCGLEKGTTTSLSALGKGELTRDVLEAMLLCMAPISINRVLDEQKRFQGPPPWLI